MPPRWSWIPPPAQSAPKDNYIGTTHPEEDELRAILANPAQQGEVVREWIPVSERLPADSRDVLVYCSDTDEHMVGSSMGCGRFAFAFSERGTRICCKPSHWRYIDEGDKPAALAASTGQEVGK